MKKRWVYTYKGNFLFTLSRELIFSRWHSLNADSHCHVSISMIPAAPHPHNIVKNSSLFLSLLQQMISPAAVIISRCTTWKPISIKLIYIIYKLKMLKDCLGLDAGGWEGGRLEEGTFSHYLGGYVQFISIKLSELIKWPPFSQTNKLKKLIPIEHLKHTI